MSQFHDLINSNLIQGKIFFDKSLENLTWLKVGGKASCLYIPKNKEDLAVFLKHLDSKVKISVFGNGYINIYWILYSFCFSIIVFLIGLIIFNKPE